MSSHPASIAAIRISSSSRTAGTSTLPLRSYMNSTDPCSAIFAPLLFTHAFTSAVARLALSLRTLMIIDAPPIPYASNVDSEKFDASVSDALLMARLMLSTGTELALAALMTSASWRFAFGSVDPPFFTAIMIFFPNRALVLAFLASVLDLVAARTAAARPMNRGDEAPGAGHRRSDDDGGDGGDDGPTTDAAVFRGVEGAKDDAGAATRRHAAAAAERRSIIVAAQPLRNKE
mmetsp:Transcript_19105/g.38748  ORF Transcript_19105/g.38748 Transcript_19105/m.38748 type:complete len:233 (-) Transcript_19105:58-756(-)